MGGILKHLLLHSLHFVTQRYYKTLSMQTNVLIRKRCFYSITAIISLFGWDVFITDNKGLLHIIIDTFVYIIIHYIV
jgi:hypothetical protein